MKHKFDVLFRTIAAVFGGYLLSVAFSFAFVPVLVWTQASIQNEAVMVATMLSYVVFFAVTIISFCRKSTLRLWRDLLLTLCLCWVTYWLMGEV